MKSLLGNTRKGDITFCKSGLINISANVSKSLSLTNGDVIDIMVDDNEEYLLYVKHRSPLGRHCGMVYSSKSGSNHFRASSVKLCRLMLAMCGVDNRVTLSVGEPARSNNYGIIIPIITKNIIDYD